jgi:DHA3 family multidrug efflux protein-like MFS transporter
LRVQLWVFISLSLFDAITGNLRAIALSTLVTVLIEERERDKANGMVGTANGVAVLLASIMSGLAVGFVGIFWTFVAALVLTVLTIVHLLLSPETALAKALCAPFSTPT